MKMNSILRSLLGLVLCIMLGGLYPSQVLAQGKLDAFEADVSARAEDHSPRTPRSESHDSDSSDDVFTELFVLALMYGGATSWQRVADRDALDLDVAPRETGESLIPFARLDLGYQNVDSDIDALDVRGELGYGPVGAHLNFTRYWEQTPGDTLNIIRISGLYRMSFGAHVETDLGFGVLTLQGAETHSSFLFSLPILVHPSKYWGVEFRPVWAERLTDYDLALMLSHKATSLKLGYRWVASPNESLNGPYVGISVRL